MSMKLRITYIASCVATCVSLLSSCALDDLIDQSRGPEIAFRPALGTTIGGSRSPEVNINTFKDRPIIVTAVTDNGEYYFKDVLFTNSDPSAANPVYTSDLKYYWPGDGSSLHFTAYPADYETRGILDRGTGTIKYQPMSSWYADEYKAFDGTTALPYGVIIKTDNTVRLPDGETIDPDGTVHYNGNVTIHPDKRVELDYGDITMDTDRNITLSDSTVINRLGVATLPDGVELYPNGNIKVGGTVITRAAVGSHTTTLGIFTVNADGSVDMPDGSIIPAIDATYGISLPSFNDIFIDNAATANIHCNPDYDESVYCIGLKGDITFLSGDELQIDYGVYSLWLSKNATNITIGGDIVIDVDGECEYTISPDREVSWITERNSQQVHEDIVLAHATGSCADIAGLPLNFSHKLSQIQVWAKNSNPNYHFDIVSVKIANVIGGGELSINKEAEWTINPEIKPTTYEPGIDYNHKYYIINPDNGSPSRFSVELETNVNTCLTDPNLYMDHSMEGTPLGSLYGSMMVVPQTLTPWDPATWEPISTPDGAYLAVKLRISTTLEAKVYPIAPADPYGDWEYAWVAVPLSGTWEPGKRYVYNLDFSNGAGYSDPEDEYTEPHLVLNGPFSFTTTVSDWTTGSTDSYPIDPTKPTKP